MKAALGVLLLVLSSCAAPNGAKLSIAESESRHEEILDRRFGELNGVKAADPEAEFSFQQSLSRSKVGPFGGAFIDVRYLGEIHLFSNPDPEPPRRADYGLYANPIP